MVGRGRRREGNNALLFRSLPPHLPSLLASNRCHDPVSLGRGRLSTWRRSQWPLVMHWGGVNAGPLSPLKRHNRTTFS